MKLFAQSDVLILIIRNKVAYFMDHFFLPSVCVAELLTAGPSRFSSKIGASFWLSSSVFLAVRPSVAALEVLIP